MTILAFGFPHFLLALVWACFAVLNLWIWQKTKAKGNLWMLVGGAALCLAFLLWSFESYSSFVVEWLPLLASVPVLVGFYLSVAPMVEAQMAAIKGKLEKLKEATAEKAGDAGDSSDASDSGAKES